MEKRADPSAAQQESQGGNTHPHPRLDNAAPLDDPRDHGCPRRYAPGEADETDADARRWQRRRARAGQRLAGRAEEAVFRQDWDSYARIVAENYLNHREAYTLLRKVLLAVDQPFRFLDIACGDASASAPALAGTGVSHYRGIDRSEDGLARAAVALAGLGCPVELELADFTEALRQPGLTADIAWVGLSLHHLDQPGKFDAMRDIRRIVGRHGHLLIYENASPVDESRADWLERWDADRPNWTAFSDDEWASISRHVHAADFPETDSAWREIGLAAGFAVARCLYASPNELFRLYAFGPKV